MKILFVILQYIKIFRIDLRINFKSSAAQNISLTSKWLKNSHSKSQSLKLSKYVQQSVSQLWKSSTWLNLVMVVGTCQFFASTTPAAQKIRSIPKRSKLTKNIHLNLSLYLHPFHRVELLRSKFKRSKYKRSTWKLHLRSTKNDFDLKVDIEDWTLGR